MTNPIRILFVDNQVDAREWLAEKLRRTYQFAVDCAGDGDEALACVAAAQGDYDVALIDMRLGPGRDGIEVMKSIQSSHPGVEVIIITGFGDVDDGLRAMREGACNYVLKPLRDEELIVYIRAAAERRRLKAVERERDLLEKILDVSQAATRSLNPEEIARQICERTAKLIPNLDLLHISIYDEPRDEFRFLWVFGSRKEGIKLEPRPLSDKQQWGLTGHIIKNGSQFHNDLDAAERQSLIQRINLIYPPSRALIGIQLISGGRVIGAICAQSDQQDAFTQDHYELLQTVASHIALAVENALFHEQQEQSLRILSHLYETLTATRQEDNLDRVLNIVVDDLYKLLELDTCTIGFFDDRLQTLSFDIERGLGKRVEKSLADLPKAIRDGVFNANEPIIFDDLAQHSGLSRALVRKDLKFFAILPLRSNRKLHGIVTLGSKNQVVLAKEQWRLLQVLADQVAIAVEKERLQQEEKALVLQLYELNQMAAEMAEFNDYKNLCRFVAERAAKFLHAVGGAVYLLTKDGEQVEVAGVTGILAFEEGKLLQSHKGLLGEVLRLERRVAVPNYWEWEQRLTVLDDLHLTAVVGVPIISGSRLLGVLVVHDRQEGREFNGVEQGLLVRVGKLAGAEIEKTRISHGISSLAEISDFKEFLHAVADRAAGFLRATSGAVYLLVDEDETQLEVAATDVSSRAMEGKRLSRYEGLVGEVLTSLEPFTVSNYSEWQNRLPDFEDYQLQAVVGVPIVSGSNVLGVLVIHDASDGRTFTTSDSELLARIGRLAGAEIEKARILKKNEQLLQERDATGEMAQTLVSVLKYDQLLDTILENLRQRFGYTTCAVLLENQRTNELYIERANQYPEDVIRTRRIKINDETAGVTALVARTGQPKIVPDVSKEPLYIKSAEGSRSEIAAPLIYRDKTFGVLNIESANLDAFDDRDLRILTQTAAAIAIAIKNAQLYDQVTKKTTALRRKTRALRRLQEVSRVVNSTLVLDDVLEKVLVQLQKLLPYDSASIQLKVGDVFKVVACDGFEGEAKREVMQLSFPINPQFPDFDIVNTQMPLFIPDVLRSSYSHFWQQAEEYHTEHIRTWLGVPLLYGKVLIGLLAVDSKQLDAYNKEQQNLCIAFANEVVSAIANAMAYKNAQSLNLLGNVQDIKQRFDLEATLKRVVDGAVDKNGGIGSDIAIIYPYNPNTGVIDEQPVYAGFLREPEKIWISPNLSASAIYRVLNLRRLHSADDVLGDDVLDHGFVRREGIASAAGVPLLVGDEPVGVMFVNFLSRHVFTQSELTWMNIFAQQAGIAIQTARQFERFESASDAAVSLAAMSAWAHDAANETYSLRADAQSLKLLACASNLSPKVTEIVERIKQTAEKVATLIPGMPTDSTEKQPIVLAHILRDARKRRESDLQQKHIEIAIQLDSMPPVFANEELLQKVADHLIQNAIKAMPKGGQLSFSGYVAAARAYIKVADTGSGIPVEIQEQLFIRRVPSAHQAGSGMGLLLTRIYLFACGGDIRLHHSDASGTTFIFHLPLADIAN
ncbi:MAG: GAF domain-containing protein [Acidobacteria bacterium]|nr:GAF domain-containing protein [Acidobacteriota bacterium]MBI3426088.1 GAF domain-containing protein [Acidobacteriota bacterium]